MYPKEFEDILACLPKPPEFSFDFEGVFETALSGLLEKMRKTPQNPAWHAEGDVWTHTKMVCEELCALEEFRSLPENERLVLSLSALLHDAGKPFVTRLVDGAYVSPGHAARGASEAREVLWRKAGLSGKREYQCLRESVCFLIRYHTQPAHLHENENAAVKALKIAENVRLAPYFSAKNLCILTEADERGRINSDKEVRLLNIDLAREIFREARVWRSPYSFICETTRYACLSGKNVWKDQELFDDTWGEVILMCGLAGTGKDTYIKEHYPNLPVVSLDDIRCEMKVSPDENQGRVIQAAHEKARKYLRLKQPFVWNATSLMPSLRKNQVSLFEDYGARVKIVFLETGWAENIRRDKERKRTVSEKVIGDMLKKLVPPEAFEARNVVWECV